LHQNDNIEEGIWRTNAPPFHWNPELELVEPVVPVMWAPVAMIVVGVEIVRVGLGFWESDVVGARHHECLDVRGEDDRRERD
jgi:hypothetical protein